jgi:hypothetical protein
LLTSALLALAACSGGPGPQTPSEAHQALTATNGDGLNGDGLNGDGLNGDGLNGPSLGTHVESVTYASAMRHGAAIGPAWLDGSQLMARVGMKTLVGQAMAGVTFTGRSDTGKDVTLRVEAAWQDAPPNEDVWEYDVRYLDPAQGTWWPLCQDATGAPIPAIAVDGYWSYARGVPGGGAKTEDGEHFTFACKGVGAIGKCILPFGYKPWATVNGVPVDRYHQTCVRMVRADFCGDGMPHTTDGRRIDLYDGLGIQQDTEPWFFEAEWDENGARCFSPLNRSHRLLPCYLPKLSLTCGARFHFEHGALMMDETPTLGVTP